MAVVGVGGVGSVTAEMLTRCGIGKVGHHVIHCVLLISQSSCCSYYCLIMTRWNLLT